MKKYEVIGRLLRLADVGSRVKLTAEQFRPREHALRDIDKGGTYEIVQPIEFKLGETFEYSGDFGKGMDAVVAAVKRLPKEG